MKKIYCQYFYLLLSLIFVVGCNNKSDFEINNFIPILNGQPEKGIKKIINLDYTNSFANGFLIPSPAQISDSMFHFEFYIKNTSNKTQKFFYKIYYQNESYKFVEYQKNDSGKILEHPFACENFYGSWEDVSQTFLSTSEIDNNGDFIKVTGKIKIVGNPRDEQRYYGADRLLIPKITEKDIIGKTNDIKNNKEWFASIVDKAQKNNISVEKQLHADAMYMLEEEANVKINNRWKRNPRTGYYSFMLVVTTEENIKNNVIPLYVQNISLQDNGRFMNPFYYFQYGHGKDIENTMVCKIDSVLKVSAHPDLSKGIYINPENYNNIKYDTTSFSDNCGIGIDLRKNATISQFVHNVAGTSRINNIPEISDVSDYSKQQYENNKTKFNDAARKDVPISTSTCPCKTVAYSGQNKSLIIRNPGNEKNEYKKENVGIITRHGLTYGKYRVRAKLSNLLNKNNVWNGITNAIWLMSEEIRPWNNRRICNKGGYLADYYGTKDDVRKSETSYSEIDFEILKAAHYWPKTSYKAPMQKPVETPDDSVNIMVTCTNWDMACPDPLKYNVGVHPFKYFDKTFDLHRWDYWYKAVTAKTPFSNKELFNSEYYWFEIEWKPEEIIWRIGTEKDKMQVVCYMNSEVTSIPNNQMLLIVTQEYHITKWWPEAPFNQEDIPFPLKDIVGKVYEIEIE